MPWLSCREEDLYREEESGLRRNCKCNIQKVRRIRVLNLFRDLGIFFIYRVCLIHFEAHKIFLLLRV